MAVVKMSDGNGAHPVETMIFKDGNGNQKTVTLQAELNLQERTATPGLTEQEITAGSGYDALGSVLVPALTKTLLSGLNLASLDANFTEANIKNGVPVFGKVGTYMGSGEGGTAASYVSDVIPVFHTAFTLPQDYTDTSTAGTIPLTQEQEAAFKTFMRTNLFGHVRLFQTIIAARNDVTPDAGRLKMNSKTLISEGGNNVIGNINSQGVYAIYSDTAGNVTAKGAWNSSNNGMNLAVDRNGTTVISSIKCDGTIVTSIGAGTYDIWVMVIDDLDNIGGGV